jgi:hypothetical protein
MGSLPYCCCRDMRVGWSCWRIVAPGVAGPALGASDMDQSLQLVAMTLAAALGILATLVILRKQRRALAPPPESQFAVSTEGEKRCPACGMGNLWMQDRCITCGAKLAG